MKAAVIGLGPHGRRIVAVFGPMPGVELAAVVDQNQDVLRAAALPVEVAQYASMAELTRRGDIELVSIATNAPSHAALAVAAMDDGVRRLMVEKPMACSLAEA